MLQLHDTIEFFATSPLVAIPGQSLAAGQPFAMRLGFVNAL